MSGMFNAHRVKVLEEQMKEVLEKLENLEKRLSNLESKKWADFSLFFLFILEIANKNSI